jgi:hypothetical protein
MKYTNFYNDYCFIINNDNTQLENKKKEAIIYYNNFINEVRNEILQSIYDIGILHYSDNCNKDYEFRIIITRILDILLHRP